MKKGESEKRTSSQVGDTPVEVDSTREGWASPRKKRGKRSLPIYQGQNQQQSSLFNFSSSQDSVQLLSDSQHSTSNSQEVVNRLGQLSCKISQENPHSLIDGDDSQSSNFNDMFSMPSLTPRMPNLHQGGNGHGRHRSSTVGDNRSPFSDEKTMSIAPAIVNPFVANSRSSKAKGPTTIWLHPYRERPRYIIDFEEEGIIGEGKYSVVYKARKRLDGTLYAIKKLKKIIQSESEGTELLREVCALAALRGCPNLIRYFGCWVEDNQLWIQCELCLKINLDVFVRYPDNGTKGSNSQFPMTYKPRQSTTPHSFEGSNNSPSFLSSSDMQRDGSGGLESDIDSQAMETSFQLQSQQSSLSQNYDEDDNDYVADDSESQYQPWLLFTPEVFWKVLLDVSRALAFMHDRGLAHMDIRPANILLAPCDICKGRNFAVDSAFVRAPKSAFQSTSLFDAVQQNINTPRASAISTPSDVERKFNQDVEKTYQELTSAIKSSTAESVGIAFGKDKEESDGSDDEAFAENITAINVRDHIVKGDWVIRVADLGLCCNFGDYIHVAEGESRYCAVELIQGDSGTQDFSKADMFSMGASLYEMCSGEPLSAGSQEDSSQWHDLRKGLLFREKYNIKLEFLGNDEGFTSVVNTNRNPVWDNYPNDILAVLEELMNPNPPSRPSAADMINLATHKLNAIRSSTYSLGEESESTAELRNEILKLKEENESLRRAMLRE